MVYQILLYILKINFILVIGYLFYKWILSRLTHFHLNRWILIIQFFLLFLLPFVHVPQTWYPPSQEMQFLPASFETFFPSANLETPLEIESQKGTLLETTSEWNFFAFILFVYSAGLLLFLSKLIIQFFSLAKLRKHAITIEKRNGYQLFWCKKSLAPFSFFNQIFLPHESLDTQIISQIIRHEEIHVRQMHSWDVMMAEILLILCWFNPFSWMYKRAVIINLEYLTDHLMLKSEIPKRQYIHHLLSISFPDWKGQVGISYNQSFLQKRIKMMNKKVSSARSLWAYAAWLAIIPSLVFCNRPVVTTITESDSWDTQIKSAILITRDASPEELKKLQQKVEKLDDGSKLSISDLVYNSNGKISKIRATMTMNGTVAESYRETNTIRKTIAPIYFERSHNDAMSTGGISEKELEQLISQYYHITIFTAGIESDKASLEGFHQELELLTHKINQECINELEQNNWQSETSGSSTFGVVNEGTKAIIQRRIDSFEPSVVWFKVDDGEKQSELPSIDWDEVQKVQIKETQLLNYKPYTLTIENRSIKDVLVLITSK
ncbi:MAG: M56 family metallopeptidase [Bacteroidota bacterium]